MMINYLIFEILLIALTITSPEGNVGTFKMSTDGEQAIVCDFSRVEIEDGIEGMHRLEVMMKPEGITDEEAQTVIYHFIDNALYGLEMDGERVAELDVVNYYTQINWDKITSKKQRIKDSNKKPLFIIPDNDTVTLSSPSNKLDIVIDRKYFKD